MLGISPLPSAVCRACRNASSSKLSGFLGDDDISEDCLLDGRCGGQTVGKV